VPRSPAAGPSVVQAPDPGSRPQVYLHAGQLVAASTPTAITTVLGSCVAVCLHDPVAKVGGMNHFLLPLHVERDRSPRFGTIAVPQLVDAVVAAGGSRRALVAKVFGGASVIGAMTIGRRLGDENVRLALRLLDEGRIPVLDQDVGGSRGRKVVFFADEGIAWVRQL
jgi:chemotaxis protein CheD